MNVHTFDLMTVCRMIRIVNAEKNERVKAWARDNAKASLLCWSILYGY